VSALLEAIEVSKSFGAVHALKRVSFELSAGEVHALIGENGAGKSTLVKIITGALEPDSGELRAFGEPFSQYTPAVAKSLGIAAIYQQPSLFPDLTVAENIAVALERGGLWRRVDWMLRAERAAGLLARAGSSIDPQRLAGELSMPEQQIVEIAKAIGAEARIVIMDEPTASLTDREVERLFEVIGSLRASGVGVIYISHRLEEISKIADRVTVLRDGENVAMREIQDTDRSELIRLMVGRELSAVFPKREPKLGEVALGLRGLSCEAAGITDVSLEIRAGEILGLAGLVGSGRTELAETLFGLTPADRGTILVGGQPVRIANTEEAIALGIGYVPEDRRKHGVALEMTIAANVSLASLHAVSRHGLIDNAEERNLASGYAERLRIKAASIYAEAGSLSGGNQQKVALARWLAIGPKLLILDEPTQGVDVGAKAEIHRLIAELANEGLAILMISSELPEILGMSDRITVMCGGSIAAVVLGATATQHEILSLALGHGAGR
jgi:rhamnose transport system ATP-binding protein